MKHYAGGKFNRHGQAAVLTNAELDRIARQLTKPAHRAFFAIARYTGERWGAICKLETEDCYQCISGLCEPRNVITFRARTRKAAPTGARQTRQVIAVTRLVESLGQFEPQVGTPWLFPSPFYPEKPITFSAAYRWLERAVDRAGLKHRGVSTHSLRRSFITRLAEAGTSLHVLQEITGHKSVEALRRYIAVSPDAIATAMANTFQ